MSNFSAIGYLDDEAINALRSAFETLLVEKGITHDCIAAEDLAATIVNLYLAGVTDVDELLRRVRVHQAA